MTDAQKVPTPAEDITAALNVLKQVANRLYEANPEAAQQIAAARAELKRATNVADREVRRKAFVDGFIMGATDHVVNSDDVSEIRKEGERGARIFYPEPKAPRFLAHQYARSVIDKEMEAFRNLSKPTTDEASEPQSTRTEDGCPTEGAVLAREWRAMRSQLDEIAGKAKPIAWIRAAMVETVTKEKEYLVKVGEKQEHPDDVPLFAQPQFDPRIVEELAQARRYRFLRNDPPTSLCVRSMDGNNLIYVDGQNLDELIEEAILDIPLERRPT